MTFRREINLNGLPYIWLNPLYFFRTTLNLRHFEGDKNELELYNKTTIVVSGKIPGPDPNIF